MAFSLLSREDEYFVFFSQMIGKIQKASDIFVEMLAASPDNFTIFTKRIKNAEHAYDKEMYKVTIN